MHILDQLSALISHYWVLSLTGVILLAEIIAGRHRLIHDREDCLINAVCMVIGAGVRPLGAVLVAMFIGFALPAGKGALAHMPFWPALFAIILAAELANYWVHRLSHEWKDKSGWGWLWRMHRTHHTAKYVNVLLNFRISLFWSLVAGLTWVMSLALYLGLDKPAWVAITIFSFWGIFTHSDFRWDDPIRRHRIFGPTFRALEHIFISPGIHHSHHGYGKDGGNFRNFGIFLSIFDWAFGSLHIPEGRPFRYGIPGKSPHWADDAFSPLNVGRFFERRRDVEELEPTA
jgi:sterol desaturase/sphingolipid hydroxylase (fatty acid hydroxylase superfamily)